LYQSGSSCILFRSRAGSVTTERIGKGTQNHDWCIAPPARVGTFDAGRVTVEEISSQRQASRLRRRDPSSPDGLVRSSVLGAGTPALTASTWAAKASPR
jgi:hypothetical protein